MGYFCNKKFKPFYGRTVFSANRVIVCDFVVEWAEIKM